MQEALNHINGLYYGLARGLVSSLLFLILALLNALKLFYFYLRELYTNLLETVEGLFDSGMAIVECLFRLFVSPYRALYNLGLNLAILVTQVLQSLFNVGVSTLSLIYDLGLDLGVNLLAAVLVPFVSAFQGFKMGHDTKALDEAVAQQRIPPYRNFYKELAAKALDYDLPLNHDYQLQDEVGCEVRVTAPQNTFFAPYRIQEDEPCLSFSKTLTPLLYDCY